MTSLATAWIDIRPDLDGFGGQLRTGVRGSAAIAGSDAGRSFSSRFGAALKIGAALAGAFAVTKGVQFLKGTIEEAREASVVTARTANVIKSMGNVAGVTSKQVADLAGAISNKVGIDDEAIQSGQNLLLTFGQIRNEAGKGNDIFSQTTGLMVDMSVAMDQDLKSSAIQLGKALNDPIAGMSALSRVGVQFTAQQKKQIEQSIKQNDVMGAQKIILAEVKRQFGGAGKAMSTPADRAKVAWANLKEQIGNELLPILSRFQVWLTEKGIPAVSRFIDQMKKGEGPGGEFADFMIAIKDAVMVAAPLVGKMVKAFNDIPGWAKTALVGGGVGLWAASKLRGPAAAAGGLLGGLGVQKVFVVNMTPGGGFGGAPGGGKTPPVVVPPGGKTPKGIFGRLPLLAALPALGSWTKDLDEVMGSAAVKLESFSKASLNAFNAMVRSRTGMSDLAGATAQYDQILQDTIQRDPAAGFRKMKLTADNLGVSMKDLKAVFPGAAAEMKKAGVNAHNSGLKTGSWTKHVDGLGNKIREVDGKKPSVPWKFPDLSFGLNTTGKLGQDTDRVGKKKGDVPWSFPNLIPGIGLVNSLGRAADRAARPRTLSIHLNLPGAGALNLPGLAGRKAAGGPVMRGRSYLVGERGPEVVTMGGSGHVTPNHRLGGGGGLSDSDIDRLAGAMYRGARDGVAGRDTSAYASRRVGR